MSPTVTPAAAALLGGGIGLGAWLIVRGLRPTPVPDGADPACRCWAWIRPRLSRGRVLRLVAAAAGAVVVAVVTGWPVAVVLVTTAAVTLPRILGPDRGHQRRLARTEAIAAWAEMLRDTLSAAAGLEQALLATAPLTPVPIRDAVEEAAAQLRAGRRLPGVLRALADTLAEPGADLVLAALLLAAEQQARDLADLLGALASAARAQAALQMATHAQRATSRSSVRITVATTLIFAVALAVFDHPYLSPYRSANGQLVLLSVGALFGFGFWLLHRIAHTRPAARILPRSPVSPATPAFGSGTGAR